MLEHVLGYLGLSIGMLLGIVTWFVLALFFACLKDKWRQRKDG